MESTARSCRWIRARPSPTPPCAGWSTGMNTDCDFHAADRPPHQENQMTREQVMHVVVENIVDNLEDVARGDIHPEKSMKDLGANSLDIVEVVSCSMRDLKIKVPRSELAGIENIGQLVDLLHRVAVAKAA